MCSPFIRVCLWSWSLHPAVHSAPPLPRHPGVSNNFLCKSSDLIALRYNDDSVLENMHAAEGFIVMSQVGR